MQVPCSASAVELAAMCPEGRKTAEAQHSFVLLLAPAMQALARERQICLNCRQTSRRQRQTFCKCMRRCPKSAWLAAVMHSPANFLLASRSQYYTSLPTRRLDYAHTGIAATLSAHMFTKKTEKEPS